MDIGLMLKQSWEVVWRHKFLWVFGFFAGSIGLLFDFIRLFSGARITTEMGDLWKWLQQPQPFETLPFDFNMTQVDFGRYFMGGVIFLFIVLVVFWIIATIAEAGVIYTVSCIKNDESVGLNTSLRASFKLIGRFLAIDAIIFFPWFVIILTVMLMGIGLLLYVGYVGLNNADLSGLYIALAIVLLCMIPLTLVSIPVAWLSFLYRILAFRDAVILNHSIRQSIKHTWIVVRANFGTAVLVTLLMMAIQSIGNWIVSLLSIPVFAGLAYLGGDTVLGQMMGVVLTLITAVISGIIYAYIATAWTITYKYWVENGQQATGNSQQLTTDS